MDDDDALAAVAASTPSQRPIVDVVGEVLTVKARMEALKSRLAALRADLETRAREVQQRDGVAPTWRARGLGLVTLSDPRPAVKVTDKTVFDNWAAQNYPTEVTGVLQVAAADLPTALELLQGAEVNCTVTLEVREAWLTRFLDGCVADGDHVLAPGTGQLVEGVGERPGGEPTISVRLDSEAKARAIAEAADPVAGGILTAPLGRVADELGALRRAVMTGSEDDDAAGEPDYEGPAGADPVASLAGFLDEDERVADLTGGRDLNELPVPTLKAICRRLQLPIGGRKADLLARIRACLGAAVAS